MRLYLQPHSFTDDFSSVLQPMFEAFYSSDDTKDYSEVLWGKQSPAAKERAAALIKHGLTSDSNGKWMVVTDADDNNRIVSIAEWQIITGCTSKDLEPWKEDVDYFESSEECAAASKALYEMTSHVVNAIKSVGGPEGEPHVRLKLLCTHPDYQRKGAGKAQVRWGCELADFLDLPAWVEASANGTHLYRSCGFEEVAPTVSKTAVWEIRGSLMRRPPRGAGPVAVP